MPGRPRSRRRRWPLPRSRRSFDFLYPLDAPIEQKIEAIATRVYGADGIYLLEGARRTRSGEFTDGRSRPAADLHGEDAPSRSPHDAALANASTGFTVTVRDLRAYTGAGWIVALWRRHA